MSPALAVLLLLVPAILGQVTWVGPSGGMWDNDAFWSSGLVPGPSDEVVVLGVGDYVSVVGIPAIALSVRVRGASTLEVHDWSGSTVHPQGSLVVDSFVAAGIGSEIVIDAFPPMAPALSFAAASTFNGPLLWHKGEIAGAGNTLRLSPTAELGLAESLSPSQDARVLRNTKLEVETTNVWCDEVLNEVLSLQAGSVLRVQNGGEFQLYCCASPRKVTFLDSSVDVSTGSYSTCLGQEMTRGMWNVTDGLLSLEDAASRFEESELRFSTGSTFSVYNADVTLVRSSFAANTGSGLEGSAVLFLDQSDALLADDAFVTLYSGALVQDMMSSIAVQDSATVWINSANVELGGLLVLADTSNSTLESSNVTVLGEVRLSGRASLTTYSAVVDFANMAAVSANGTSELVLSWDTTAYLEGQFTLKGLARLRMQGCYVETSGMFSLELLEASRFTALYADVEVSGGEIRLADLSTMSVRGSYVEVGGMVTVSNDASVRVREWGSLFLGEGMLQMSDRATVDVQFGSVSVEGQWEMAKNASGLFEFATFRLLGSKRCPPDQEIWTCNCTCGAFGNGTASCGVGVRTNECSDTCEMALCGALPCSEMCLPPQCAISCNTGLMDVKGRVQLVDTAWIAMSQSEFDVDGGELFFMGGSSLSLNSTYGELQAGSVVASDSARVSFQRDTYLDITGLLEFQDNATFALSNSGTFLRSGTKCLVDRVFTECTCNCQGAQTTASCDLNDPSEESCIDLCFDTACGVPSAGSGSDFTCGETCYIEQCNSYCPGMEEPIRADVRLGGYAVAQLTFAELGIDDGELSIDGHSKATLLGSYIEVPKGGLLLRDHGSLSLLEVSHVEVGSGRIELSGSSTVSVRKSSSFGLGNGGNTPGELRLSEGSSLDAAEDSYVYVADGSLRVLDTATFSLSSSAFDVGGEIAVENMASIGLRSNSSGSLGGTLRLQDHAAMDVSGYSEFNVWGGINVMGNASFAIDGSYLYVESGEQCAGVQEVEWCTCECRMMFRNVTCMPGDSIQACSDTCLFDVCPLSNTGEWDEACANTCNYDRFQCKSRCAGVTSVVFGLLEFTGDASGRVTDSTVELNQGTFSLNDRVTLSFARASVYIRAGSFRGTGTSAVTAQQTFLSLELGDITYSGGATLSLDNSTFEVLDGSVLFSGTASSVLSASSELNVFGGQMEYRDATFLRLLGSSSDVRGALIVKDAATVELDESSTAVEGDVRFEGSSSASFSFSDLEARGSVRVQDKASFALTDAALYVSEKRLPCNGTEYWASSFCTCPGAPLLAPDEGSASCPLDAFGDGEYQACVGMCFASVCGNTDLLCLASCDGWAEPGCTVPYKFRPGSFEFLGNASGVLRRASGDVGPGTMLVSGNASLAMTNATVAVRDGAFRGAGDSLVDLQAATLQVESGELTGSARALFLLEEAATLALSDGSMTMEEDVRVLLTDDSTLRVDGGVLRLDHRALVRANQSAVHVGGLLELRESAKLRMYESLLEVFGTIDVLDRALLELVDGEAFVYGTIRARNDAQVVMTNAELQLYEQMQPCSGMQYWDRCFCEENVTQAFHTAAVTCPMNAGAPEAVELCTTLCHASLCGLDAYCAGNATGYCELGCTEPIVSTSAMLEFRESASLDLFDSRVFLVPGVVEFHNDSVFSFRSSEMEIRSGKLVADGNSSCTAVDSVIEMSDGEVRLNGYAAMSIASASELNVYGGLLQTDGHASLVLDDSQGSVHGNMVISGRSSLNTTLSLQDVHGLLELRDRSASTFLQSNITVYGKFLALNESSFALADSQMEVLEVEEPCTGTSFWSQCYCECGGGAGSSAACDANTGMAAEHDTCQEKCFVDTCASAMFPMLCESTCVPQGCELSCDVPTTWKPGVFTVSGATTGSLVNSEVVLFPGRVQFDDESAVDFSADSTIEIYASPNNRGSLAVSNDARVTFADASGVHIFNGDIALGGTTARMELLGGSYITLEEGAIDVGGSSALVSFNSSVRVYGGELAVLDTAEITMDTSYAEIGGTLLSSDMGRLVFDNDTYVAVTGSMVFRNASEVVAWNSTLDVRGTVQLLHHASMEMLQSIMFVELVHPPCSEAGLFWEVCVCQCSSVESSVSCGANDFSPGAKEACLDVCYDTSCASDPTCVGECRAAREGWCQPGCSDPGANQAQPGLVSLSHGAHLDLNASSVYISPGELRVADTSACDIFASSLVEVFQGSIYLSDLGELRARIGSRIELVDGLVSVRNDSRVVLDASELDVYDGVFELIDRSSGLLANGSSLELGNGEVRISDSVTMELSAMSSLNVYGGECNIGGNGTVALSASEMGVEGGVFAVGNYASITAVHGSQLKIADGLFVIANRSDVSLTGSSVVVEGGTWTTQDHARVSLLSSTLRMSQGFISFDAQSELIFTSSAVNATAGTIRSADISNIRIADTSLDLLGVELQMRDMGDLLLSAGTEAFMADGLVSLADGSFLDLNDASLVMDGSESAEIRFNDMASLLLSANASVNVAKGLVAMEDSGMLTLDSSSVTVDGGLFALSGVSSFALVARSSILVTNGTFRFNTTNQASVTTGSTVEVRSGNMDIINGLMHLRTEGSLAVTGGDMNFRGTGVIDASASTISVVRGQLSVLERSNVTIGENATAAVTGGDFLLSDHVHVQVVLGGVAVSAGSLVLRRNASFDAADAVVTVSGGDFSVEDLVSFTASASSVTVSDGSLLFSGSGASQLTASEFDITGGSVVIGPSRSVALSAASNLRVSGGSLAVDGHLVLSASSADICGGNVDFWNVATLDMAGGGMNVCGGNLTAHDTTRLLFEDSAVLVAAGLLSLLDDSCIELRNTSFSVLGGSFVRDTTCAFRLNQSSIVVNGGELVIGSGVTELVGGSGLFVLNGTLIFEGDADVSLSGGELSVTGGSMVVRDGANLDADNALVTIDGGDLVLQDQSTSSFADSKVFIRDGFLATTHNASAHYSHTELHVTGGDFVASHYGSVLFDAASSLFIEDGHFNATDHAGVTVEGAGSHVLLSGGSTAIDRHARFTLDGSAFTQTGGGFATRDDARVLVRVASVDLGGGDFTVSQRAAVELDGGAVAVTGGDLVVSDRGELTAHSSSLFEVTAGDVLFRDAVQVLFSASDLVVSEGNVTVRDNTTALFENVSTLQIAGGHLRLQDGAVVHVGDGSSRKRGTLATSAVVITGGSSTFSGTSQLILAADVPFSQSGGSFTVRDSASISLVEGGNTLLLTDGSFVVQDSGLFTVTDGSLEIDGGDMELSDSSHMEVASTVIKLRSGSYVVRGSASATYEDSAVTVSGGDAEVHGGALVYTASSLVVGGGGDVRMSSGSQRFEQASTVEVAGGSLIASGGALTLTDASSCLVRSGAVSLSGAATFTGTAGSLLHLVDGDVGVRGDAELRLLASTMLLDGAGSVLLTERALLLTEDGTDVTVSAGSLEADDDAQVTFRSGSSVVVSGGAVKGNGRAAFAASATSIKISAGSAAFSGASTLQTSGGSFSVSGGSLAASASASVAFSSTAVKVTTTGARTGLVSADGVAEIELRGSSSLLVEGSVVVAGSAKLMMSGSSHATIGGGGGLSVSEHARVFMSAGTQMAVDGGGVAVSGDGGLDMLRAVVNVRSGNLTVFEQAGSVLRESEVSVSDGVVALQDEQVLRLIEGSTLAVRGGSLLNTHQSQLLVSASTVLVESGSLLVEGAALLDASSSALRVLGGSLAARADAVVRLRDRSSLLVTAGVRLAGRAFLDASFANITVSGGTLAFAEEARALVVNSTVTVDGELGSLVIADDASVSVRRSAVRALGGASSDGVLVSGDGVLSVAASTMEVLSNVRIGGSATFHLNTSSLAIRLGSLALSGTSDGSLTDASVDVEQGDWLVSESAHVSAVRSHLRIFDFVHLQGSGALETDVTTVDILDGSFEMSDQSLATFRSSTLTVASFFVMRGDALATVSASALVVESGAMQLSGAAVLSVLSGSSATIRAGDVTLTDSSALLLTSATLTVAGGVSGGGGSIAMSGSSRLLFALGSVASVEGSVVLSGSAQCEVSGGSSMDIVGGDLQISGTGLLRIASSSRVHVQSGLVRVLDDAEIHVSDDSELINRDQLVIGGPLRCPEGNRVYVEADGVLTVDGSVDFAPGDGLSPGTLESDGMVDMCGATGGRVTIGVSSAGEMHICDGELFFDSLSTSGKLLLLGAQLQTGAQPIMNTGELSGTAEVDGDLMNDGAIMHGENGTLLAVSNFDNGASGILYIVIDDPEDIGVGVTRIEAAQRASFDGTVVICIGDFDRGEYDRVELILYDEHQGEFAEVRFECIDGLHRSAAKYPQRQRRFSAGLLAWLAKDDPEVEYSGRSFAVLFSGTGGGSGWSVTDPILWLSVGLFVLALLCVVVNIVMYALIPRYRNLFKGNSSAKIKQYRKARRSTMLRDMSTETEEEVRL